MRVVFFDAAIQGLTGLRVIADHRAVVVPAEGRQVHGKELKPVEPTVVAKG